MIFNKGQTEFRPYKHNLDFLVLVKYFFYFRGVSKDKGEFQQNVY